MGPFEKWSERHSGTTLRVWGIGTKPECPPQLPGAPSLALLSGP